MLPNNNMNTTIPTFHNQQHHQQHQQQPSSSTSSNNVQILKSSPWTSDDVRPCCTSCHKPFDNLFNRRHHCRLCGDIFCNSCSQQRALIPPSSIVLQPQGGKKVRSFERSGYQRLDGFYGHNSNNDYGNDTTRLQKDDDPDRTVTYATSVVDANSSVNDITLSYNNDASAPDVNIDTPTMTNPPATKYPKDKEEDENIGIDEKENIIIDDDNLSNFIESSTRLSNVTNIDNANNNNNVNNDNNDNNTHPPKEQNQQQKAGELYQQDELSQGDLKQIPSLSSSRDNSTFESDQIPPPTSTILYGKGLEERMKLAREPLRVCVPCHQQLQSIQEELRIHNSNAMKYNSIDPTNIRRLLNSPLAFTLGHEVRKAAYTLNNLLPMPKRLGLFVDAGDGTISGMSEIGCDTKETCKGFVGNFGNVDGVRIPAKLLERAKGVAVMTCIKTGVGVAGIEFGTGLVVSRLSGDNHWSPPCAIGTAGLSWGALVGLQLSDHVFLLMTDKAVDMFVNNDKGSFQLGADIGVAVGPLGRSLEADVGAIDGDLTPIYTYSLSKGFYAGASLDGKVIVTRHNVNEKFYGRKIDARSLLSGDVPTPPAAQPLYDALKRCHVYASTSSSFRVDVARQRLQQGYLSTQNEHHFAYGDGSLSSYEIEDDYNMSSRHYAP